MLIYDVILDVGTTGCQQTVSLYQGDDRSKLFRVTLLQNGKVYTVSSDLNVRLYAVKPDEDEISVKCGVRGGSVFWLPAANATDVQGTVRCQMQIRDHSGAVLFTPEFSVEVVETLPVPELPEGASENAEYNTEVLSELSASEDGRTLLFRGEPVGAVHVSSELPQSAEEDAIVYLTGEGMFRYTNDMWVQLTDDEMIAVVALLQQDSHTHANKTVLDKMSVSGEDVLYDGKPIGVKVVLGNLPNAPAFEGKIVYCAYYSISGFYYSDGTSWIRLTDSSNPSAVSRLLEQNHAHENKTTLDKLTESFDELYYNGKRIGIETVRILPDYAAPGKILYKEGMGLLLNSGSYQLPEWTVLTISVGDYVGLVASRHEHENMSTLDKLTEENGRLLFGGNDLGGVRVYNTPNAFPANAPDGSVAAAQNDGISGTPVAVPVQIADEEISADIEGVRLAIGTPTYSEAAIGAAITAGNISACGSISLAENNASIVLGLMPVVADLSDNPFTSAGITLDPDTVIVTQQSTKKYTITLDWSHDAQLVAHPDKITEENGQTTFPISAFYAFEDLETEEEETVSTGWNVLMATVDTAHGHLTNIETEPGVDINDYIVLPASDENTMTLEGTRAAELFAGVVQRTRVLPAGLYIKRGTWKRLAEAETAET